MRKPHILLIDDDPDEFEIFLMALEKTPELCECSYAPGGTEALKLLRGLNPDFIFLDMNMPLWNGWDCLREIRKIEQYRSIPIVFYSTAMDSFIEKRALDSGVARCIRKPIRPGVLEDILKQLFYKETPMLM